MLEENGTITLDAKLVLKGITGESDEVKALTILCHPVAPPPIAELCPEWASKGVVDPPQTLTDEERASFNESLERELEAQGGVVVPNEGVILTGTVSGPYKESICGTSFVRRTSRERDFSKLDFGWLPLEEYAEFRGRQYTADGKTLRTERAEPRVLDTATFVSALVQLRDRVPGHLELLIFSDPVVKASDETTTIKVVFVLTREMHETALNRPQWLVEILDQEFHKVARTFKTPQKLDMNISHRLTKDGGWQALRKMEEVVDEGDGEDPIITSTEEKVGEPFQTPR
jgi:hypothetical protein